MKYNKEKTKKFEKGGKTPQEIMEEARRNQAIERSQATNDVIRNSGIPAFQSQQVAINVPRPTVELTAPNITQRSDLKSMFKTRGEAFNYARKQGWNDFNWGGGRFHTKTAEEVNKVETPQTDSQPLPPPDNVQELVTETPTGTSIIPAPQWGTYGQFPRTAPRSTASASASATQSSSNWWERFNENNAKRRERAQNRSSRGVPEVLQRVGNVTNKLSMRYQQGGKIEDKPLYLRNIWEKVFGITPDYTPVNSQESITRYIDNTRKGPVEKRVIRKEVPYANLHSTMSIRNPGTNRADTTFTAPSGTTYNMNDVRSGKAPLGYSYKFFEKPTGYFQQGGTVDKKESSSTDQLYVDFAIRYLKAKGISEDNMVDNEGGLKDEFLEEISTAISEVDSPEFWEQYKSNPDAVVQSYVESKMEPEQIEMAKKGAKLKKLKKGGMKSKKCKCGCNLIMKKEAGGTIVEVCACGCKNK